LSSDELLSSAKLRTHFLATTDTATTLTSSPSEGCDKRGRQFFVNGHDARLDEAKKHV
jgi:hypothetical protein